MWDILKSSIASIIRENNNQEITGPVLQSVLFSIINIVGENATFKGVATQATNPGIPEGPVFYLANAKGLYPNFNTGEGVVVITGFSVIKYNANDKVWESSFLFDAEDRAIKKITSNENPVSLEPNILYKLGTRETSLDITFLEGEEGKAEEYMFEFIPSSDDFILNMPSGVVWLEAPDFIAGNVYQVSVMENLAVIAGWEVNNEQV